MNIKNEIAPLYENPNLIIPNETNHYLNCAVDVSSLVRAFKLTDCKLKLGKDEIYVPGESYLLSFRQLDRTVRNRKKILRLMGEENIIPKIIDFLINDSDKSVSDILSLLGVSSYSEVKEWAFGNEFDELRNFAKICQPRKGRNKVDLEGLVLVKNVNPIEPIRNYELNGICYTRDQLGKIKTPVEIKAWEAEFSFVSDACVKITDGDGRIGRYKDGILTLQNAQIFVENVSKPRLDLFTTYLNKLKSGSKLAYEGGRYGLLLGLVVSALAMFSRLISKLELEENVHEFMGQVYPSIASSIALVGLGGLLCGSIYGFCNSPKVYLKEIYRPRMKVAFIGNVKDRRFENLENVKE